MLLAAGLLLAAAIGAGMLLARPPAVFDRLLPAAFGEPAQGWVQPVPPGTAGDQSLTDGQLAAVLDLLRQPAYGEADAGAAMQGCYARLYLADSQGRRVELLLRADGLLLNPLDFPGGGRAYRADLDALASYLRALPTGG